MKANTLLILTAITYTLLLYSNAATTDGNVNGASGPRQDKRASSLQELNDDFFKKMKEAGFSLGKSSSSKEKEGDPAEFGFTDDINASIDYRADFFLQWNPPTQVNGDILLSPSASVEGHLSSTDNKTNDVWRFRLGFQYDTPLPGQTFTHVN